MCVCETQKASSPLARNFLGSARAHTSAAAAQEGSLRVPALKTIQCSRPITAFLVLRLRASLRPKRGYGLKQSGIHLLNARTLSRHEPACKQEPRTQTHRQTDRSMHTRMRSSKQAKMHTHRTHVQISQWWIAVKCGKPTGPGTAGQLLQPPLKLHRPFS